MLQFSSTMRSHSNAAGLQRYTDYGYKRPCVRKREVGISKTGLNQNMIQRRRCRLWPITS